MKDFNDEAIRKLKAILPADRIPSITRKDSMPGEQYVGELEKLGDAKLVDRIGAGGYIPPDINAIAPHYFKGIALKTQLASKLSIQDRDDNVNCALGYGLASHYYLDEFGLSMTTKDPYPDYIVQAAKRILLTEYKEAVATLRKQGLYDAIDLADYDNVRASFPRGKNSGFPWIVSGMDRMQNDLVLSVNALLARLLVKGVPVDDIFSDMLLTYTVFSRYQRSAKPVPMMLNRPAESVFFEPRRRVVNGGVKALGMALKPLVKWHTVVGLETSMFQQDRKKIQARAAGYIIASDKSRFDLRHGGIKLQQGLDLLYDVASEFAPLPTALKELLHKEATLDTALAYGYPEASLYITSAPAIRSGSATTSRVGSVLNLMNELIVTNAMLGGGNSAEAIVEHHLRYRPVIILGDDAMRVYPRDAEGERLSKLYREHIGATESIGVPTEEEIPAKFLGYGFDPDGTLTHSTNPLSNMFFPERFKTNAIASMLIRYTILKHPKAMNALDVITNVMRNPDAAAKLYGRFLADCMPGLAEHYKDHPKGGARQMFASLPTTGWDGKLIQKGLMSDIDEVLLFISKGSSYDFNYALIGHPEINDMMEEEDSVVKASLNTAVDKAVDALTAMKTAGAVRHKSGGRADKVLEVLSIFQHSKEDDIIRAYRAMLPRIARQVFTPRGSIFIGDI